ncbi:MAG: MFS transporter [Parachlamydiaceae bacterium]
MHSAPINTHANSRQTHLAYLWIHALSTPMWAIFNLLPYILYKDLHASPLQITILVTLKPLVSLLSVYWGSAIHQRRDRLLSNIIWARIISLFPFFFFPFVDNIWFFIGAFGLYMLMARGVSPAWMEILKLNLPKTKLGHTFSKGALIGYCGNIISPFLIGWILDDYVQSWRWLFPITAFISLTAIILSAKIPIPPLENESTQPFPKKTFQEQFLAPWKTAWKILRASADFRKFQWGFMLGGASAMVAQPILPQFCVDTLNLSYTEMTIAFACCKGIGFVSTTPLWARLMNKINIFRFASWPPFWVLLYSFCLLIAQLNVSWIFIAYFCYGVMEGGSALSWNLSGPLFSKEEDSSGYTNINVLAVGIRACIFPPLGTLCGLYFGPAAAIALGGVFSLLAVLTFTLYSKETQSLMVEG